MIKDNIISGYPNSPDRNTPNECSNVAEVVILLRQLLPKESVLLIEPRQYHPSMSQLTMKHQSKLPRFLGLSVVPKAVQDILRQASVAHHAIALCHTCHMSPDSLLALLAAQLAFH
jgi:hypothetical protein